MRLEHVAEGGVVGLDVDQACERDEREQNGEQIMSIFIIYNNNKERILKQETEKGL